MSKILYSLFLLLFFVAPAHAELKATTITSGNTGLVTGLTIGSSAAAGTNKTVIQNALNSGGHVTIDCAPYLQGETDTIGSAPYTISVAGSGPLYINNSSVIYTNGTALTPVTGAPSTGQYTVSNNGFYTFAAGDSGKQISILYNILAPIWLNGHLTLYSNTDFEVKQACHLEQAANTGDNMLVTAAYLQPWTVEYQNSGVITTGPLSIIWSGNTPSWATTTGFSQGNYVNVNGAIYWAASTGTSASTGSGPSGIGSGGSACPSGTQGTTITDGTVTWCYVTTYVAPNTGTINATVYYPNSGLTYGSFLHIAPEPDSGSSNVWSGTQTAHTRGGPADSAYFGNFYVYAVNDSNYVTVVLERMPAAAFTGIPIELKPSDHDQTIRSDGTWDYNGANNTPSTTILGNIAILSSTARLKIDTFRCMNAEHYCVDLNAYNDVDVGFVSSPSGTFADIVKSYGGFNGYIHDIHGNGSSGGGGDDIVSIQPVDVSPFTQQIISSQDALNIKLDRIRSDGGAGVRIYNTHPLLLVDNVTIDGVSTNDTVPSLNNVVGVDNFNSTTSGGPIGTLTFRNVDLRQSNSTIQITGYAPIQNLILDTIASGYANEGGGGNIFNNADNAPIQNITIRNMRSDVLSDQVVFNNGTVLNFNIDGGYVGIGNTSSDIVFNNGSSSVINKLTIQNLTVAGGGGSLVKSAVAMPSVNLIGNNLTTNCDLCVSAGTSNLFVSQNTKSHGAVAQFNGTATINLTSGGGNQLSGGAVWEFVSSGTAIWNAYGFDIQADVTKLARTTGEYIYNTNTAPGSGTLTTAGPVMDQGTSSNSWFLLSNPSGQQY